MNLYIQCGVKGSLRIINICGCSVSFDSLKLTHFLLNVQSGGDKHVDQLVVTLLVDFNLDV